ncbi:hypothetical protein [Roseovarius sp. M141]|uniref:hypothetical protein n=1 Tax=Roseovarius sp. M141 TaxID=2583806 RepID=UPI0020CC2EBD|nr:hypothetical protein [Roseovarius sp. M141]MCQ0090250.1 hypothetical protein [Roseovarius sp. M141]
MRLVSMVKNATAFKRMTSYRIETAMDNTTEEYFTPKELAERTAVSIALIRQYMRDGELEYIQYSPKNRKIRYSSWLDLVKRNTHPRK